MNFLKNLLKPRIIAIVFLVIILNALLSIFSVKFAKLSARFKNTKSEYEKILQLNEKLKNDYNKLEKDFTKTEKDYQAIALDRDNLLTQIKGLLVDRTRARELDAALEKTKTELEQVIKEKENALQENLNLKNKINGIETRLENLTQEKTQLANALDAEKLKPLAKKLAEEKASLEKQNSDLANKLKQTQSDYNNLKKSESEARAELAKATKSENESRERTNKLEAEYAQAVNKNKALEQRFNETPQKFSELARQNTILIKQTANMHYNLGVFYMREKDYSRAIAEFEKALELTPDDAYAHFNLGYIYAEYVVNRPKAIEHFRNYLRLAKKGDKDLDWVKKYIITWEAWQGKSKIE